MPELFGALASHRSTRLSNLLQHDCKAIALIMGTSVEEIAARCRVKIRERERENEGERGRENHTTSQTPTCIWLRAKSTQYDAGQFCKLLD